MNPYSYPNIKPNFNLRLKETTRKWFRYAVDFPTAYPSCYEENNTARGEYFRPVRGDYFSLAILLHGIGDRSVIPCKLLARALVKNGIACFILYSVFHSSRIPETIRKRLPALTSEEWFKGYQVSVIDVRQVVDWASGRVEINKEQIAAVGISFGGFISAIAMGIDRRIKAGVFLVTGGNSEVITWQSKMRAIRAGVTCTEAECHHIHSCYPQYLAEVAEKGFENVTPAKECFLTDSMTFASSLRKRPILMCNALWDGIIPRRATLDFWEACGKPAITWFPATHATICLWYPFISRKITSFLRATFGMQERYCA
jgi:esterase/lipase